jgi:5-methylcytosine-specific restriction endonuclease McrA
MGDDVRRCAVITLNRPSSKTHQKLKSRQNSKTRLGFEKTRKQLGSLSDRELLGNLQKLSQKERRLKVLVLLYLSEIDKRQLYLPMGYSSLFDFCTMRLRYPRATAARRIRSARAAAMYPEALDMLISGEINITTLSMMSDILDQDNHEQILSEIRGRTTRQVELLASRHKPVNIIRDTVRPVCFRRRVENAPVDNGAGTEDGTRGAGPSAETKLANPNVSESGGHATVGGDSSPSAETKPTNPGALASDWRRPAIGDSSPSAGTKPGANSLPGRLILEQRLKLGFTVTPEFMKKYTKIKSLLSSRHPEGINFETLFDILMNEYLEKHDPDKKHMRRAKRDEKRKQTIKSDRHKKSQEPEHRSRTIPPAIRDQVHARDNGRCSFIGANGKRCGSTWDLEIDHVIAYARGGDNSPGNLRLLCRKHNIHQAERAYGREFMKDRIKKE